MREMGVGSNQVEKAKGREVEVRSPRLFLFW